MRVWRRWESQPNYWECIEEKEGATLSGPYIRKVKEQWFVEIPYARASKTPYPTKEAAMLAVELLYD